MLPDSISRFSRTVENYRKYRPTYPQAIVEFVQEACHLTDAATLADVGSGTGLLSEVFLKNGYRVWGVEPNVDMRLASQDLLRTYPNFVSVAATAEETTLDRQSIDMITVGQAFDWFNRDQTRQEFARILKPEGWVVLVWNMARRSTPFLVTYEQLCQKYLDPQSHRSETDRQAFDDGLRAWFSPGSASFKIFDNAQVVDYEGLTGRVLSSSYAPAPDQPEYTTLLEELETVFQNYQVRGTVTIEYDCRICYGQLYGMP
jgi:ubiquinone/menaquinone biosynthesis C-methylase UbiE